jgi:Ca2+-binding EF-hand superfamily protein
MIPLIGLGLCKSVGEVQDLFNLVDTDNSGEIEFDEFLEITANRFGKC